MPPARRSTPAAVPAESDLPVVPADGEDTPDVVRNAPRHQVVGRLDEVAAARKPVLRWALFLRLHPACSIRLTPRNFGETKET